MPPFSSTLSVDWAYYVQTLSTGGYIKGLIACCTWFASLTGIAIEVYAICLCLCVVYFYHVGIPPCNLLMWLSMFCGSPPAPYLISSWIIPRSSSISSQSFLCLASFGATAHWAAFL